jgi:DNA modification methylase
MQISDLIKNPKNPRTITDKKLKMLKNSMEKFGDLSGIVFNKKTNRLVGGHQRLSHLPADAEIVITDIFFNETDSSYLFKESPPTGTLCLGYLTMANGERFSYREVSWSEEMEIAANIAANKGAGEWDELLLTDYMMELDSKGFDLDLTLFDLEERTKLFPEIIKIEPTCHEDEIPEKVEPKTKLGDIYKLGDHRLMCGDSTSLDAVEKLMNGEKADMVFTDPPYGVKYEQGKFKGKKPKKQFQPIANDEKQGLELYNFILDVFSLAPQFTSNAPTYIWSPALSEASSILAALIDSGMHVQSKLIWKKQLVLGRADYQWAHEQCFYGWYGEKHKWFGGRSQTTVAWEVNRDGKYVHPTQKPVKLAETAINNSSEHNDIILDLFGGSGSTLIACEKTNRRCFMSELDPHYVDVIVQRWMKYSGKMAYLIEDSSGKLKEPVPYVEMDSFPRENMQEESKSTVEKSVGRSEDLIAESNV